MALAEKTFGHIKHEGNAFWVDNENEDKVKFEGRPIADDKDFFIMHCADAFENARDKTMETDDNDSEPFSLERILGIYEDFRAQAEEMVEKKGNCKGKLVDFINVLAGNLGKNAVASMLSKTKPKPSVSVIEKLSDYKPFVEVKGKPVAVNAIGHEDNLLLLDGTSVEQLLIPEAVVLVRLKPAVEEKIAADFKFCCDILKECLDNGVTDRSAVAERIESLMEEKNKENALLSESASAIFSEKRKFERDSEEYKKLDSEYYAKFKEKAKNDQVSKILNSLKWVIYIYYYDKPESVSYLKREILRNHLISFNWIFDIPGFVTRDDVKFLTSGDAYKIEKNQTLNGVKLDNDTFYVRAADLRPFSDISAVFSKRR